jgi:hypothetical protein
VIGLETMMGLDLQKTYEVGQEFEVAFTGLPWVTDPELREMRRICESVGIRDWHWHTSFETGGSAVGRSVSLDYWQKGMRRQVKRLDLVSFPYTKIGGTPRTLEFFPDNITEAESEYISKALTAFPVLLGVIDRYQLRLECQVMKRYLREMPYADYLKTSHWWWARTVALRSAGYRCQLCNSDESLNVHHRTYERRGEELPGDLTVLCRECHTAFHERKPRL